MKLSELANYLRPLLDRLDSDDDFDPEVLILDEETNVYEICEGEEILDTIELDEAEQKVAIKIQFFDDMVGAGLSQ